MVEAWYGDGTGIVVEQNDKELRGEEEGWVRNPRGR